MTAHAYFGPSVGATDEWYTPRYRREKGDIEVKLLKFIGFVVAMTSISACSDLMTAKFTPEQPSDANVEQAKAIASRNLFDPESAQFRDIKGAKATYADGSKRDLVCFEMNAKNRLGGYVGYSPYTIPFYENGTPDGNTAIVYYCNN